MRTLFVGAYGFGNLGDELCLIEAINAFPSDKVWVRTISSEFTAKCIRCDGFIPWSPARPHRNHRLNFDRVILGGGGILGGSAGTDYMSWIVAAQRSGAKTYVHNVGIAGRSDSSWITPDIRDAFRKLDGFSVRDSESLEWLKSWGVETEISLTHFPETGVAPDMSLTGALPDGGLLGISIGRTNNFLQRVRQNGIVIGELIQRYRGMKVLPVISTVHRFSEIENDIEGFKEFYEMFLTGFENVLPETLDKTWWVRNMTPQKLKGLISKCDVLISRRKHNCVHAISCGVKTIGLTLKPEAMGLSTVFDALRDRLPQGSQLIALPKMVSSISEGKDSVAGPTPSTSPSLSEIQNSESVVEERVVFKSGVVAERIDRTGDIDRPACRGIRKTRIAIFHDYFRVIGGAEKLVLTLARELGADVITSEVDPLCIDRAGFLDVKVIPLGEVSRFSAFLPAICRKRFGACDFSREYHFFVFSGSFSIYAAQKHKPNLWYCHTPLKGIYGD